jgi:hypothetical protein
MSKVSSSESITMEDEELVLCNACGDLVSLKKFEAFPRQLLRGPCKEWIGVGELCRQAGVDAGDITPGLFVIWLPDPTGNESYAVVIFYDDETKWTMAAHYNRTRVLGMASQADSLQPTGAAK